MGGFGHTLGLLFEINADPSKARAALAAFTGDVERKLGISQGSLARFGAAGKAAAKDLLYLGGIATGVAAGALALAKQWSDAGFEIFEAGQQLALTSRQLSGLRVAAKENREEFGALTTNLARFQRNITEGLTKPSGEAGAVLQQLFKDSKDLSALGLKPMGEQMQEVARRAFDLEKVGERNYALNALLGRGWQQNFSTLQDLAYKGFDPLIQRAKDLNELFDESAAARARQFGFELDRMKIQVDAPGLAMGQRLVPYFNDGFIALQNWKPLLEKTRLEVEQLSLKLLALPTSGASLLLLSASQDRLKKSTEELDQAFTAGILRQQTEIEKLIEAQEEARKKGEDDKRLAEDLAEKKKRLAEAERVYQEHLKKSAGSLKATVTQADLAAAIYSRLYVSLDNLSPAMQRFIQDQESIQKITDQATRALLAKMNADLLSKELSAGAIQTTTQFWQEMQKANEQLLLAPPSLESAAIGYQSLGLAVEQTIPPIKFTTEALSTLKAVGLDTFNQLSAAMGQNIAFAIVYEKSIKKAVAEAAKATLASISAEATVEAIRAAARGVWLLSHLQFAQAGHAFASAALWGSIGGAAAAAGRLIPSGEQVPAGAQPVGVATGAGSGTGVLTGGQAGEGITRTVFIEGLDPAKLYSGDQLIELIDALNDATQNRDIVLHATSASLLRSRS